VVMSDLWVEVADRDERGIHVVAVSSAFPRIRSSSRSVTPLVGAPSIFIWRIEFLDDEAIDLKIEDGVSIWTGTVARVQGPTGPRLSRFATANDVHVGEIECGRIESMGDNQLGPVLRSDDGAEPYPDLMNRTGVQAMVADEADKVLVNGDLTSEGTVEQYTRFLDLWAPLAERMHHIRGNHDAAPDSDVVAQRAPFEIELPGLTVATLDTVRPGHTGGTLHDDQLERLDDLCARSTKPVLVCGHHPLTHPGDDLAQQEFNIPAEVSQRLVDLARRRTSVCAYAAGHTHRNAMRVVPDLPNVAFIEVASLKDYPGVWGRYDVFGSGIVYSARRVLDPDALSWTERTRHMFAGTYGGYSLGPLSERSAVLRWRE